jgi:hypothetical protein
MAKHDSIAALRLAYFPYRSLQRSSFMDSLETAQPGAPFA